MSQRKRNQKKYEFPQFEENCNVCNAKIKMLIELNSTELSELPQASQNEYKEKLKIEESESAEDAYFLKASDCTALQYGLLCKKCLAKPLTERIKRI